MNYHHVKIDPEACIAGNATLLGNVVVEKDVTILFNATLRSDSSYRIVVGEGSNVQDGCCVHLFDHDCIIGKGVTVGHGAILHGCTIGDNTLVGMGSIIMEGAVVGRDCIVASGTIVTSGMHIPDGVLALGCPAKAKRSTTEDEIATNREDAKGYLAIGRDLVADGIIYGGANVPTDIRTIAL